MRRGKLTGRNIRATPAVAQVDVVVVDGHFSRPYRLRDVAVERIVKKLRIKDSLTAEEGYHDAVRTMARKPYPALEGMRNVRRLLETQDPCIGAINVEDLVDNCYIRILDESGFFARIYGK